MVVDFPSLVDSFPLAFTFPLGFSSSDSALAPLHSFPLGFSSDSASLLSESLAACLGEDFGAPPLEVFFPLTVVAASFKLISAFPSVVDSFPLALTFTLGFSSSDSALAPVDSFTLGFSSDSASLLSKSLADCL